MEIYNEKMEFTLLDHMTESEIEKLWRLLGLHNIHPVSRQRHLLKMECKTKWRIL